MKTSRTSRQLSFQAKLERLAPGINYFALTVPSEISEALETRGPVPVSARVNGSTPFLVSLYTKGGGRHGLRVKAEVRAEAKIKEGDLVRVQITVIDRTGKVTLAADLTKALKSAGVLKEFEAQPRGQMSYIIRRIDEAAKPETREKRIHEAVKMAGLRKGR